MSGIFDTFGHTIDWVSDSDWSYSGGNTFQPEKEIFASGSRGGRFVTAGDLDIWIFDAASGNLGIDYFARDTDGYGGGLGKESIGSVYTCGNSVDSNFTNCVLVGERHDL